jgi:hypothetical protein
MMYLEDTRESKIDGYHVQQQYAYKVSPYALTRNRTLISLAAMHKR